MDDGLSIPEFLNAKKNSEARAAARAKTPVAPKPASAPQKPVGKPKPESKTDLVAALLRRPEGCTTADALAATGWPAISMPATAKAAGITLVREKDAGKPTRYYAA